MQERFFSPGMDIGIGINLLNGNALIQGVTGTVTTPEAAGQTVKARIVRIDDMSTLHTSLGVDVSASGSYAGFSASDKMDFADSCGFNEHSIYLLISITVTNALTRMNSPALIPEAALLLQNQKPDRFRERFGDVFVAGVHTGGEYFAIFQITGTEESEKESLSNTVTASYTTLGAGVDLSVAVNKAKESSHTHLDMKVFTFQSGGADTTQDQDPGQILTKAHNFAPSVTGVNAHFSVPYAVLPESYSTLNLPGDSANLIDIENQKEMLAKNFKVRNDLMLLINNIDYILLSNAQNHEEFEPFDTEALTADRNRLAAEFDRITQEASACMRDANRCHLATFEGPSKPLPKKLPSAPTSLVTPNFVGMTVNQAMTLSSTSRINIDFQHAQSPDDIFGEDLRVLEMGRDEQNPHSDDQIVINVQRPVAGSFIPPGTTVSLGVELMPGIVF